LSKQIEKTDGQNLNSDNKKLKIVDLDQHSIEITTFMRGVHVDSARALTQRTQRSTKKIGDMWRPFICIVEGGQL
jgi:hypothetical protein